MLSVKILHRYNLYLFIMVNFGKLIFGLLWSDLDRSLRIIVRKHCGRPWQWSKLPKTDNLLNKMVYFKEIP